MSEFVESLNLKTIKFPVVTENDVYDCLVKSANAVEPLYEGVDMTPQLLSQQMYATTLYAIELVLQKYQYKLCNELVDLILPR